MTSNDPVWIFSLNSVLRRYVWFGALKPGFRSLATLKLIVNVVGELKRKRTAEASRGFLWQHGFLVKKGRG